MAYEKKGCPIRFGLGALKGVGSRAAELVAEEREKAGGYSSLDELCERLDPSVVNKTALEALAKAGALESLGLSRRHACEEVDAAARSTVPDNQAR